MTDFLAEQFFAVESLDERTEGKNLDELTVFQSFGECVMKNKCLSTFIGSVRPSEVIQNYWSANQNNFVLAAVSLAVLLFLHPSSFVSSEVSFQINSSRHSTTSNLSEFV